MRRRRRESEGAIYDYFIAFHTDRPLASLWYANDMIAGPWLPPCTFTNHTDQPIDVCWLSAWQAERCIAILDLHTQGVIPVPPGADLHISKPSSGVGDWELVPIP